MTSLYVTSLEPAAGKTALAIGLGRWLQSRGKKVGYFKLCVGADGTDADAEFARQALGLKEPVEALFAALPSLEAGLPADAAGRIRQAYQQASRDKDVVVIEGLSGVPRGSAEASKALGVKALLLARYDIRLTADQVIAAAQAFGISLLGVVLNAVPANKISQVRSGIGATLQEKGIKVLGILPQDRALLTLSVVELAQQLDGQILNQKEAAGELVEHVMVGAMCLDPGPLYFGRKANKAVVTRGDRPDIQMAALETPTRCIVLSGGAEPMPIVRQRADMRSVALISVKSDTLATVAKLEEAFPTVRFRQPGKLARLDSLLREHLDLEAVKAGLG